MLFFWWKNRETRIKIMNKIFIYEYLSYFSIVILIITIAVWNSFVNPSDNIPRILPTIIYNIPLLIIMIKLNKNKFSTYIMSSYIMLLYFVVGVGNIIRPETFLLGLILSVFSMIIFFSSIMYVREINKPSINN